MRISQRLLFALCAVSASIAVTAVSPALAASPWWHLSSGSLPAVLQPESEGEIVVSAANLGDSQVNGKTTPVTIVDTLPPGLTAVSIQGASQLPSKNDAPVKCPTSKELKEGASLTCTFAGTLPPYYPIEILIGVKVGVGSAGENVVSVSGGEAPGASIARPVRVGGEPAFGVEDYELSNEEDGGAPDTQAGSHPFQQTTTLTLNQTLRPVEGKPAPFPVVLAKDLNFKWPAGLIGNPTAFPRCTLPQFLAVPAAGCPPQTAVGAAYVKLNDAHGFGRLNAVVPLFNLEPSVGEPARFGFIAGGVPVYIDPSIRTGGDYGVTLSVNNITQTVAFLSSVVTVWGVPGDPRHDSERGWGCLEVAEENERPLPCNASGEQHPPPLLSLPTSCPRNPLTGEPEALSTSVEGDSWEAPGVFSSFPGGSMPALDGCDRLPFTPEITATPDGQETSKPSGLKVDVHVPQEGQLNGAGLAQSNIKDIAVTLPAGVTLNPSAADGLSSCTEAQIGFTGFEEFNKAAEPGVKTALFTPKLPGSFGSSEPLEPGKNFCPDASKIGEVTIKTPLLPNPLKGFVYLASPQNFASFPQENPFGSLVSMYIVAEDPVSGSLVKLPGQVSLNPNTGQISSTFENNPQLAFEDAELHFFGGERAPLATPSHCGSYTTEATFTPWSGTAPVKSTSTFQITSGPNGTACPGASLPFSPSLATGTTNINAASFTNLETTISRDDGQQNLQSVTLHYPPGLSGLLSGVPLCPEAQANAGTCGPASEIGETIVSVGLGGDPFTVTGGKAYITEKYAGAPFGLSIVNPAAAGPFDLQQGRPVVVRAKVDVDPHTAAGRGTAHAVTVDAVVECERGAGETQRYCFRRGRVSVALGGFDAGTLTRLPDDALEADARRAVCLRRILSPVEGAAAGEGYRTENVRTLGAARAGDRAEPMPRERRERIGVGPCRER